MTGICWRIHVSQIRQSNETCHRNSDLSDLKRMRSDLRHQFTEMETKYRSINETKAQICELLTSRRDQTCSQNWIRNKDRCYFISTVNGSYDGAKQHCSSFDSRLLEMNSHDEALSGIFSTAVGPKRKHERLVQLQRVLVNPVLSALSEDGQGVESPV
ncbi:oxidized low-density lipoprotein receptor 1-like [Hypanus sabinus]|uniref:oxidized low-density lipoprotein receptor 1-like n=1 Tax=Hypanus sabinus TaxID=79690 RepID=UPI0028C49E12|nr:oxidized low-density lipoprotein receptor 1-like [Hypanus sabinus]